MALDATLISQSKTTLTIIDYTGSPIVTAAVAVVPESLIPPINDPIADTEVMANASGGKVRYGNPTHGLAGGNTFSFQLYNVDVADNTEITSVIALVRALANGSVSGTAFSAYVFTNPLAGGGKLTAKFAFTQRNEAGVSHVTTWPAIVQTVVPGTVDGVSVVTVTCLVNGAITLA